MPDAVTTMSHNWAFAVFLLGVFGLIAFMLGVSSLLGSRAWGRSKNEPFEAGVVPTGSARLRLSAKFYLVAMLFVIFDVEALFLFAWAVSVRESASSGPSGPLPGPSRHARAAGRASSELPYAWQFCWRVLSTFGVAARSAGRPKHAASGRRS